MIQDKKKQNLIQSKHLKYRLSETGLYPFLSEFILQKITSWLYNTQLVYYYLLTN